HRTPTGGTLPTGPRPPFRTAGSSVVLTVELHRVQCAPQADVLVAGELRPAGRDHALGFRSTVGEQVHHAHGHELGGVHRGQHVVGHEVLAGVEGSVAPARRHRMRHRHDLPQVADVGGTTCVTTVPEHSVLPQHGAAVA